MRLVTWNAGRGKFAKKAPLLSSFGADITVMQEIAEPGLINEHCLWFGANPNQGIAVTSSPSYTITPLPEKPGAPRYVIPIQVEGPVCFTLFAVWTIQRQEMPYIRAVATTIDLYPEIFDLGPVVMLGDFNANTIWDKSHPGHLNHSSVVERLAKRGVVSAYHHDRGEPHGKESEATFYLHHDASKPFHIDYCFLPKAWADQISLVEVGAYEKWKGLSDHRPPLIEITGDRTTS
jgi:exodeoxyribonuclease-3